MSMEGGQGGRLRIRKAEIDTRAPFRSVKEAVTLFGEKILAGELYADKLKELHNCENGHSSSSPGNVTAELEETKQSLQKAQEESMLMANRLSYLKEELERTKRELQQLKKEGEPQKQPTDQFDNINEEVKVVEDSTRFEAKAQTSKGEEGIMEFQKKRYVTFANPPTLAQVIIPPVCEVLERHPSLRKKKKKPLIPLIGGLFSRKKGASQEVAMPRVP